MLGQIYEMIYENYHYIGKHDGDIFADDYYGSGIAWTNVVRKHGKEHIKRIILETYNTKEQADALEKHYIAEARNKYGHNCLNIADGGQGGDLGPLVRAKISEKVSGSKNGMYGKGLFGPANGMYGKTHPNWNHSDWHPTEEMKEASRQRMLGDNNPSKREDVRRKISEAAKNQKNRKLDTNKGKHWYTDGIQNILCFEKDCPQNFYPGKVCDYTISDNTRLKMSKSHKNHWNNMSNEEKQKRNYKISASLKGKSCTEETKQKLSNAIKGRKWINNGKVQKQVKLEELDQYLNIGFSLGRLNKNEKVGLK